MTVGIIQSSYIPWRGFFDFISSVDLFIFYDDVQYTRRDWRNRNRIKTPLGGQWLSVPVKYNRTINTVIDRTPIDYSQPWQQIHIDRLRANYRTTPYFESYIEAFADILNQPWSSISQLNVALCQWIMTLLHIKTRVKMSRDLQAQGTKSVRLLNLAKQVGANTYVSGPSAASYLDLELFRRDGIRVEYKTYDYPPYPQPWGPFLGHVTVLDLLFNLGPNANQSFRSLTPNRVAVR